MADAFPMIYNRARVLSLSVTTSFPGEGPGNEVVRPSFIADCFPSQNCFVVDLMRSDALLSNLHGMFIERCSQLQGKTSKWQFRPVRGVGTGMWSHSTHQAWRALPGAVALVGGRVNAKSRLGAPWAKMNSKPNLLILKEPRGFIKIIELVSRKLLVAFFGGWECCFEWRSHTSTNQSRSQIHSRLWIIYM